MKGIIMIIVCEPQVKGLSHEKVNSGFIYGLSLAYPEETIKFYADKTHIAAIKNIMNTDNVFIEYIEYVPIKFHNQDGIISIFTYYFLFKKMIDEVLEIGTNKIFFLSTSPTILYTIKKLKQKPEYKEMKFTFVLHGSFDNVANEYERANGVELPIKKMKNQYLVQLKYHIQILRQMELFNVSKVLFSQFVSRFVLPWHYISKKNFTDKKLLLWQHSEDYRYIVLSPHIIKSAEQYIDVKSLNMYTVIHPAVFRPPSKQANNKYVKFAIFGFGNPLILYNILVKLSQKNLKNQYEIRIIGMDNRGTSEFPNVTCPSPGKRLDRSEMEEYVKDIDAFLILYDKTRYRLSCTGSIIESLSYTKPILHFDNDCINAFNRPNNPIGICCNDIDEFVDKMEDIIENYETYYPVFQNFRNNILNLRNKCSIENSVTKLKESFTW